MARKMGKLQLTLAIMKPDVSIQPFIAQELRYKILSHGFYFVRSKEMALSRNEAQSFYKEHEGKFFFQRLVNFMSSGIINCHILARYDAIPIWRQIMGPTKVFKTIYMEPFSIRGEYGLTDTRNCTHGSDSEETARREMNFFFPDFDQERWYKEEEPYYRTNQVIFDESRTIHISKPQSRR